MNIPVHVMHGAGDELFPEGHVTDVVGRSAERSPAVTYQMVSGLAHYMACSYADVLRMASLKLVAEHVCMTYFPENQNPYETDPTRSSPIPVIQTQGVLTPWNDNREICHTHAEHW